MKHKPKSRLFYCIVALLEREGGGSKRAREGERDKDDNNKHDKALFSPEQRCVKQYRVLNSKCNTGINTGGNIHIWKGHP